jgi:hypothetical protein
VKDNANAVKARIDLPMSGERMLVWERLRPTTMPWQSLPCRPANPGSWPYNLTVRYEDDYGVQTQTETLQMTVMNGDSTGMIVAILLVLIIGGGAGYWYFVLRKKGSSDA